MQFKVQRPVVLGPLSFFTLVFHINFLGFLGFRVSSLGLRVYGASGSEEGLSPARVGDHEHKVAGGHQGNLIWCHKGQRGHLQAMTRQSEGRRQIDK